MHSLNITTINLKALDRLPPRSIELMSGITNNRTQLCISLVVSSSFAIKIHALMKLKELKF